MNRLLLILLSLLAFFCCVHSVPADRVVPELEKCVGIDDKEALLKCNANIRIFRNSNSDHLKTPEDFKAFKELYETNAKCLAPLRCPEAKKLQEEYLKSVQNHVMWTNYVHKCFPKFQLAVFNGSLECGKKHDYLTRELTKKRAAFTDGKQCFVDFVKKECDAQAHPYFSTQYDEFLDNLTVDPADRDSCTGPFYTLETMDCNAIYKEMERIVKTWKDMEKVSKEESEAVSKMCAFTEKCVKSSCKLSSHYKSVKDMCVIQSIAHTDFAACLKKIAAKNPKKEIDCFDDSTISTWRFFDSTVNKCEDFEQRKKCLKESATKTCGEVKDFDVAILKFKEWLHCKV